MMEKVLVSITKEMKDTLETERKKRLLDTIPETIRVILSEYFTQTAKTQDIKQVVADAVLDYEKRRKR
jgi:metal-responsive CopG/Arc/MetJ family transcriptional regulator